MRNLSFILILALTSCNKEANNIEPIVEDKVYMVNAEYQGTEVRTITLNGVSKDLMFQAKQGDVIVYKGFNTCSYPIGGGNPTCLNGKISLFIDNQKVDEKECNCELMEITYTVN